MDDVHDMTNIALDPIGPLVPAAPLVSQLVSLQQQAESADPGVARATAWLHDEIMSLFETMKRAQIDVSQAAREGFPVEVIRRQLRAMVRRILERDHPNSSIDAALVERETDRLIGKDEFDRQMAWALVPSEETSKPVLIPVRPIWELLCKWLDEIEASAETQNTPYVDYRRLGVRVLDALLDAIAAQQVTLVQAMRETGLPPDDLLGLIRMGHLVADGDARSPRLRRAQFFTVRFQQLARRHDEAER